jgi:hypothetical protein
MSRLSEYVVDLSSINSLVIKQVVAPVVQALLDTNFSSLPQAQILHIQRAKYEADPINSIKEVYGLLGQPLAEDSLARMESLLQTRAQEATPPVVYSWATLDTTEDRVREMFGSVYDQYQTKYGGV